MTVGKSFFAVGCCLLGGGDLYKPGSPKPYKAAGGGWEFFFSLFDWQFAFIALHTHVLFRNDNLRLNLQDYL